MEHITVLHSVGGGCDEEAKRKIERLYELKKIYHCQCDEKSMTIELLFKLD